MGSVASIFKKHECPQTFTGTLSRWIDPKLYPFQVNEERHKLDVIDRFYAENKMDWNTAPPEYRSFIDIQTGKKSRAKTEIDPSFRRVELVYKSCPQCASASLHKRGLCM